MDDKDMDLEKEDVVLEGEEIDVPSISLSGIIKNARAFDIILLSISVFIIGLTICSIIVLSKNYKLNKEFTQLMDSFRNSEDSSYFVSNVAEINALVDKYQLDNNTNFADCLELAIAGYVSGFDDKYAFYQSPEVFTKQFNDGIGNSVGLGIRVSYNDEEGSYISRVYDNSGADIAGLQEGDYIVSHDGLDALDNYQEFLNTLKGSEGDVKELTVKRGDEVLTIPVTLSNYSISYVHVDTTYDDVAIVSVEDFATTTANDFIDAMKSLKAQGYKKFIFDLRGNSGVI